MSVLTWIFRNAITREQQPKKRRYAPDDFNLDRMFYMLWEAIMVVNAQTHRIVLWNAEAEELWRYTADEVLGKRVEELFPPDYRPTYSRMVEEYLLTGMGPLVQTDQPMRVPILTKDGKLLETSVTRIPVERRGSSRRYYMSIIRDVSRAATREKWRGDS